MMYFDQMLSKYGFEDGMVNIPGIRETRDVYIMAINAMAYKSEWEAIPYDRPGFHNTCLIAFRNKNNNDILSDLIDTDDEMQNAAKQARTIDLDNFVYVDIKVNMTAARLAVLAHIVNKMEESS